MNHQDVPTKEVTLNAFLAYAILREINPSLPDRPPVDVPSSEDGETLANKRAVRNLRRPGKLDKPLEPIAQN